MADLKFRPDFEILSAADGERRRHWSDADKLRIVEESFCGNRQASATARRHGISRSLLTRWRKEYRLGLFGNAPATFMPLQIAPDPAACSAAPKDHPTVEEKVEITLTNGRRLSVTLSIDGTALTRLVRALELA
jgi:transposase